MLRASRALPVASALAICALLSLASPGVARQHPSAQPFPRPGHTSSAVAPLGGINVMGLSYGSTPAGADRTIAAAQQLHANVVRTELPWSVMEPRKSGEVDPRALAFTDRLMADAAAAGIKVIATVLRTPCWASSAPASLLAQCTATAPSGANAWPPSDPASYAGFVGYLAGRYGTQLASIEVWNEPDQANELYFAGPDKARRYAAVLRAAYAAVKGANPNVRVVAGSLVGSNGAFLRALYAAGIKGYYDGLAVHFYNLTLASLRSIHQVQMAAGDHTPLWLDEFGWTSCWPRQKIQEEQACVTPPVQGANVTNIYRSLAGTAYVAAEVLFQISDSRTEQFGVLNVSGARKPAFGALAGVLASPSGRVSPVTLRLRRRGGRAVASGSGPVGDFMRLEAFQGRVLRYTATFVLDRFNRYSITLPRALGTSGLRVRAYQFWSGPRAAAQKRM